MESSSADNSRVFSEDILDQKCDTKKLLEFELQMLLDIVHQDCLTVAAKGINLDRVIMSLMKLYADEGNLVFVLNSMEHQEQFYLHEMKDPNIHNELNSASSADHRVDMYLSGGIHFVSTRILVLDMLKKKAPIEKVTGIIVLRAHKILESCQEAFVLRLFRQSNQTGFIKAFTNSAQSFTVGFGHVERVMKNLFVKELYIWPRFHSSVIMSLKDREPKVIELHVPISGNMQKVQTYILELMNLTVKELKGINKTIELEEITTENCLTKKFHKILQAQLDLIWNQLGTRSRQMISDLKTLRHLIVTLLYCDPITFYSILSDYRKSEYAKYNNWVLLEPAELLFSQANSLIYSGDKELNPEISPKWNILEEILKKEIPHDMKQTKCSETKILILCSDKRTCHQLNELLINGPHRLLLFMALKKSISFKSLSKEFQNQKDSLAMGEVLNIKEKTAMKRKIDPSSDENLETKKDEDSENSEGTEEFKDFYTLTLSQCREQGTVSEGDNSIFEPFSQMENLELTQIVEATTDAPTIFIQSFNGAKNLPNLERTLEIIKPQYIVMYHSSVTAIREIEMYQAHRKEEILKIYFLIYSGTVEEQSYLTAMRREKEAFEYLIETKSKMVLSSDQDIKPGCDVDISSKSGEKNTRSGGKLEEKNIRQYIIVDMREFRSELPVLIHKRGIQLEPHVITVGDYILTSEICVERKSISDLIGSLKSGRLYQQCKQMSRYYTKPMLLIEFDQNKAFSWQNYSSSLEGYSFDLVQQKLLLLTIHFPKLKIIWSPNPYATAQLFEELKQDRLQPDIAFATSIGDDQDMNHIETKYNSGIYDFVRKLPGINSKNINTFLRNVKNIEEAAKLSEEELRDILGNKSDAKSFHSILHEEQSPNEDSKKKEKFRKRFKTK